VNEEQRDGIGCPEIGPKCPGRGCDHVMCIEQRRVLEDGSHAMSDDLTDEAIRRYEHTWGRFSESQREDLQRHLQFALTAERQAREQAEQERDRLKAAVEQIRSYQQGTPQPEAGCNGRERAELQGIHGTLRSVLADLDAALTPRSNN
jgi:hypothetical protein